MSATSTVLEPVCLVDNHAGIYVPQSFAECYAAEDWGISPEDSAILAAGPDHPDYWDTWDMVLNNAKHTDKDGNEWLLYQDGDLWAEPMGYDRD